MALPSLTDYVTIICTLFDQFEQEQAEVKGPKRGRPFTYPEKMFTVFFIIMQFRRIYRFKTQWRWLKTHPRMLTLLGWDSVPHRKTIATRYKDLYITLEQFISFIAQYAPQLEEAFCTAHLVEDKSLFKAQGPVWHQSDRQAGRIPDKLRHLDTDASWAKSGYHGWVYGYGLHVTCNEAAFPVLVQVETASVSESQVIEHKADVILNDLQPATVAADNSYTKAMRIRHWAKRGVALLTPALKWVNGRYAQAYHHFIQQPDIRQRLLNRQTTIEPLFDLIAKALGTNGNQKQLSIQGLKNVRTCLALATFTVQIAMIVNSIWGLALRNISTIAAAFT
jgi:hypothetical protein